MTWTYNTSEINSTSTDNNLMRVRWLVQDVSTADELIQDEEIQWTLAEYPNVFEAASVVALALSGKFAQRASNETVMDASISHSNRAEGYTMLADSLGEMASKPSNRALEFIYSGGISVADKKSQRDDTDWDQPAFRRNMMDIPGVLALDWLFPST